jgi:hypothetical protein
LVADCLQRRIEGIDFGSAHLPFLPWLAYVRKEAGSN